MLKIKDKAFLQKFSFYMASMGTAFGLGNLWRFPYAVADFGGGAFVFLYILLAIFLGIPLVISEVILGKYIIKEKTSVKGLIERLAVPNFFKSVFKVVSSLPVLIAFSVLAYYSILSAWSLHLISESIKSFVFNSPLQGEMSFLNLKDNAFRQITFVAVNLIIIYSICLKGVKLGINRWLSVVLPLFFILLLFLGYKMLSIEDLFVAARYMIYPNFHQLNFESFSYVLGHVLFTMSLGFTIYISFARFLPQSEASANSSSKVAVIDTLVSLAIGFIIFPIIIVSGYNGRMSEALFRAVPIFVEFKNLSPLLSLSFYLCVFIAAINASLGLVEGLLFHLGKNYKSSKLKTLNFLTLSSLVFSSLLIFLNKFFFKSRGVIEYLDDILINFMLPFSVLFFTSLTIFCVKKSFVEKEFNVDAAKENKTIYTTWRIFVAFILPVLIIVSICLRLFS